MSTLKPTTVRFVPDEATSPDELAIAALHLYAYTTAAELVRPGMRVLDIGFGEGYGSQILTEAGAAYRGVEVDPEIVDHASARYGPLFDRYDGTSIPESDDAFDLVVAFQMIAYLDDPQPLLREIARVLTPTGVALITTPNRVYRLNDGQRPWNRYHVREYSAPELADVLGRTFGNVTVHGVVAAEPIDSIVRARAARARKLARLDPLGLRYWLPERINTPLRRAVRRTAQPVADRSQFTLDRVSHDEASADRGLDLLAFARP
ncbi:MAG TPA: class I SAM-dependent methyltransferase [Gaiellaceae bacterium]|nr:class I SAM-dependent methyltransferase [Gaiellaceae bacterium]